MSYSYWTEFENLNNGMWEQSYGCSAQSDFEFCPCCGTFGNHYDYGEYKKLLEKGLNNPNGLQSGTYDGIDYVITY